MNKRNVACGPVQNQGWGLLTRLTLPGGGKVGIYQPRHARPKPMRAAKAARKPAKRATTDATARTRKAPPKKKSRGR
jgi:hypothetical protein